MRILTVEQLKQNDKFTHIEAFCIRKFPNTKAKESKPTPEEENFLFNQKIIPLLKEGNEDAFDEVYERFKERLFFFILRFHPDEESSKGVVQEVFIKLWENRSQLKEDASLSSYLHTIAKNLVLNRIRKRNYGRLYNEHVNNQGNLGAIEDSLNSQMVFKDIQNLLHELVSDLPPKRQEIFRMSREDNLTSEEIAHKLSVSKRTVDNQLYRALKAIKESFHKEGLLHIS